MSSPSPPPPDGERWTADYVSSNGATANIHAESIDRLVALGYITAIAIPPIGLILGLVLVSGHRKPGSRHGPWIIGLTIVASVVWVLVLTSGALRAAHIAIPRPPYRSTT